MTIIRADLREPTRRAVLACAVAAALVWAAGAGEARASYAHARAVGKRCSTCHTGTRPAPDNLNDTGKYFLEHRTLSGAPGPAGMPGPLAAPALAPTPAPAPKGRRPNARPGRAALAPFIVHASPSTT